MNWEKVVLSQYGESTAINYRTHIRKHLVPFVGEYAMRDVNPELVQHFVSCSAVSPKTTRNICITLQSMWTTAEAWRYVAHNVMKALFPRTANGDSVSSHHNNKSNSSLRRRRNHTVRSTDSRRKRAYGPVNTAA
jgi:Phage integrase, N-terminal SAM-like domain